MDVENILREITRDKQQWRCPSCFYCWDGPESNDLYGRREKVCDWCASHTPSSLQLFHRQAEVLHTAQVTDFAKFVLNFVKHVDLKHRE